MRIIRLEAKGIGPFEDLNIEFKPKPAGMENKAEIHILTGENGTGKSTILMMLASCADVSNDDDIQSRFSKNEFDYWISFDNGIRLDLLSIIKMVDGRFNKLFSKKIQEKPISVSPLSIKYSNFEAKNKTLFFAYSGYRKIKSIEIKIGEIKEDPLSDAINFNKSLDSQVFEWIANKITQKALANMRGDNLKFRNYSETISKLEETISRIIDKKIEFDLDEIPLKVIVKMNSLKLDFNVLPDGLKSIINWLSDLLMRLDRVKWENNLSVLERHFILFLDEIEVHLHPSWQRKILPVVQDLFPNAQIFISTHSPFVVGSVDGARVYKFKLDENNNSVLDSEYLTEDGNSYDRILEEIFDIKERFGVGVQKQLETFKEYKNKILLGETVDNEAFGELVRNLSNQSIELSNLMGFEIRQIERITKKSLETV